MQDIGLVLSSRDCVLLTAKRRGEIEEQRIPALVQVAGSQIRAIGHRAYRLVGRTNDIVSVFPGSLEDPALLGGFLERTMPRSSVWRRWRIWASLPSASSLQLQLNLNSCFEHSLRPKETILVPEILAAALGVGLSVLQAEEDSHRARMVVHFGASRIASGVFVDGGLVGLAVQDGSWDGVVREVQENLQFRLGTTFGINTFYKVVRSLSKTFFGRRLTESGRSASAQDPAEPEEAEAKELEPVGDVLPDVTPPSNLRSFSERGLIEYVVEDPTICRSIDIQLQNLLLSLEKSIFGCFAKLRGAGRGEIASDLFSDRIILCGEILFDSGALARYLTRLTRFRFEVSNGNPVAKGLRRILGSEAIAKKAYRELAATINKQGERSFSYV